MPFPQRFFLTSHPESVRDFKKTEVSMSDGTAQEGEELRKADIYTAKLMVHITPEMHATLKKMAKESGYTMSVMVRHWFESILRRYENQKKLKQLEQNSEKPLS